MKKFFTALLALILALAMVFTLAACQPSDPNTGDDGGKEETLQPVDAKTFVKAVLNNVTDELAVQWIATVDGETSVTAKDAEAVITPVDVNESGTQSLAEYADNLKNVLQVLDNFDPFLTETIPVSEDKNGYELILSVDMTGWVNKAVDFLSVGGAGETQSIGDLIVGDALPDGTTAAAWFAKLLAADATVQEFVDTLDEVLEPLGWGTAKIFNIITTIMGMPMDLDMILSNPVNGDSGNTENGDGTTESSDGSESGDQQADTVGELPIASVIDSLLQAAGINMSYANISGLVSLALTTPVSQLYDLVSYVLPGMEETLGVAITLPARANLKETVQVPTAKLDITIKADKDMKLTDIEVSCAFNGSITMGDGTVYAANITEATFGCAVEYGAA